MFNRMVEHSPARLDATFHALADPTRRALLARLAGGAASVTELAEPFPTSLAAVSKHIRVLEKAGLVRRTVTGRRHNLQLEPGALQPALAWMAAYQRFWDESLEALRRQLENDLGGLP